MHELVVVIPALNEERTLPHCLASVGEGVDIVVVDGGSDDGTREVARGWSGVRLVEGARGRGPQLNLGAASSSAGRLLFLHADCRLPSGWRAALVPPLADPTVALVCFRLRTEPSDPRAGAGRRRWLRLLDVRSRLPLLPYGDQAFALRREVFDAVGGFPPTPLMEDLELARSCRRRGRIVRLPLDVRTTARRFERRPLSTRLMTATFPTLYRLGVSPSVLARWYGSVR